MKNSTSFLVGLAGGSASGKTTFIRQISKDDPFFGKSDEKPKNGNGKSKPPTSPSAVDLDPERLAAAFDATPSADEYEKVEDPLGLALARSATMSSSEMLSGSEGKKKKKEKGTIKRIIEGARGPALNSFLDFSTKWRVGQKIFSRPRADVSRGREKARR